MPPSGSARGKSPGRPRDPPPAQEDQPPAQQDQPPAQQDQPSAQQDSESIPACPTRVPQALWYYWVLVWRWMYGNLLPTLTADEMARLRKSSLEVLGLKDGATLAQINKAKRDLATIYHPDKSTATDKEKKNQKMIEVNSASDFLIKPIPLDVQAATQDLTSKIFKICLIMIYLIALRYNFITGGDVFMMNSFTIGFFGRTYVKWPSMISIILTTVIMQLMGGVLRFPSVLICREWFFIIEVFDWVLGWAPYIPDKIAGCFPFWLSWFPSIFTYLFRGINWMILKLLSNLLQLCDNWWTFHFLPIGAFFELVFSFRVYLITRYNFLNQHKKKEGF